MISLPPSPSDKGATRRALLALRSSLDSAARAGFDVAIDAHLEHWLTHHPVASLGIFWPMRSEPDLRDAYVRWAARGMALALPVVVGKNAALKFAAWKPGDVLIKDAFGVSVPPDPVFVALPQALLIPCVGFNAEHYRIGYGGGFYDRTLAQTPRPLAVGIAYGCQQTDFGIGVHDIALDKIVTENN